MRAKSAEGQERKVSLREMKNFLQQHRYPELFNLLPTAFRRVQTELVAEIRSLAIACCNEHGDSDLAQDVLNLCKRFQFKSHELNKRLEEDFKTIEQMIAQERKHETRLSFGAERSFAITKEGIQDGVRFFPADTIKAFRWGITVTGYTGAERYEYLFTVKNNAGDIISASWGADKSSEKRQTELFYGMVNAAMNYLVEAVLEKIWKRLTEGHPVAIGACTLSSQGVSFRTQGFIFRKDRFISWPDLSTEPRNGRVVVSSKTHPSIAIAVSMRDTENAVLLPFIQEMIERKCSQPPPLRSVPPPIPSKER